MRNMTINFIMHRLLKYKILARELATITVGVTAESAVTPTVIVALAWTIVHGHQKFESIGIGSKNSCK